MTSLEYYIEQVEQFISALTDDIESGEGTVVTQTKLAVYREVLEHLEEIQQEPSYNSIKTELKPCDDVISRQAVLNKIKKVCFSREQEWVDFRVSQGSNGQRDLIINFIEDLSPVNPQNCDACEVGNPCLYCRHEFEPHERSEV